MKIGIAGGIGSGKSYVCALIRQRGFEVYDCDSAAKRLIRTDPDIRQQLTSLIGPDTYTADGCPRLGPALHSLLSAYEGPPPVCVVGCWACCGADRQCWVPALELPF